MAQKVYPMTAEGKERLEKKLNVLRLKKRPEVTKRIKIALSYGDLSENTEYSSAKDEQGLLESRIKTVEYMLQHSKVVDNSKNDGIVNVGKTVTFENLKNHKKMKYEIVGESEANPEKHKISNDSPIAKGLMEHKKGELVKIKIPLGTVPFKILKVE